MTFLEQEINIDIGHLLLLLALIGFIFYIIRRNEGLEVQQVREKSCRCPDCLEAVYQQALNGELYGCDPKNPFVPFSPEECNYSYRKAALHGCGVA